MTSIISDDNYIHISATDLKNKTAEILNAVHFHKNTAIVERYGKILVKIVPAKEEEKPFKTENLAKYFGILPDFPEVKNLRKFHRKTPAL